MTEGTRLRNAVHKALDEYREYHEKMAEDSQRDREHHLVSKTQVESAQRILWMDR